MGCLRQTLTSAQDIIDIANLISSFLLTMWACGAQQYQLQEICDLLF